MIPSVITISGITTKEKAKEIRAIMENHPRFYITGLKLIDSILGTYGVEYIPKGKNNNSPAIAYCNTGDTYTTTVLYYNQNYHIGNWGSIVEKGNYPDE